MRILTWAATVAPIAAVVVLAATGTSAAATSAEAVGGTEQITVSVNSDNEHWVGLVEVDNKIQDFVLGPQGEGIVGPRYVIENVQPGIRHVKIVVSVDGGFGTTALDRDVEVSSAQSATGSAMR
ncbi:hypothetical protein [Nocardia wallacei]|uniref:Uncharacterized protein n=1 Tax=Nocardia wallacei TaxID=480035 RepID=A0A7G1KXX6_9NOCA|nr:hypothetical protein [Nocardia wallacei]BCK59113.1 hypothetical protein NWFMUON74_68850 [Nocardia wallacei]